MEQVLRMYPYKRSVAHKLTLETLAPLGNPKIGGFVGGGGGEGGIKPLNILPVGISNSGLINTA